MQPPRLSPTIVYQFSYSLKRATKIAADDTLFFYFYLSKEIMLDVSCESSVKQSIYMKYQVLSMKKYL